MMILFWKILLNLKLFVNLFTFCLIISTSQQCFVPEFPSGNQDAKEIETNIRDINNFNKNFNYKFEELKQYIRANLSNVNDLDITYYLFTLQNKNEPYKLLWNRTSLENSPLNFKIPTVFIIHGTLKELKLVNSAEANFKDLFLQRSFYNILYVDYTSLNQGSYVETSINSFLVARNIRNFLKFLKKEAQLRLDDLHIIGLSLGGEIAGHVGYFLPGIGRITGLDPVNKIFEKMPEKYKLNYNDGKFVDIIHTSIEKFPKGFGLPKPSGHINFYPNGGKVQPGCGDAGRNEPDTEVAEYITASCSHQRAVYLFQESICTKQCTFIGVKCMNYEDFESECCTKQNSLTAVMGLDTEKIISSHPKQTFYLDTNSVFPFCSENL